MAAKRLFNDSERDPDEPDDKRIRNNATTPSFASVIGEMVMIKNFENLFTAMEPVLKRVVGEEVERVMRQWSRSFTRSPSLRLQAMEQPSSLQLCFSKRLFLPIFTGSRILDVDENPINIVLMERSNNNEMVPTSLPHAIKLEILVIDGDFSPSENEDWTSDEFNRHMVKERHGKRPLLAGELNLIMRDGIAPAGDMEFTDNSSWIRCRKFRVAVRVAPGSNQGVRIREGMTEAFMVKDHRGELYKKHYPPMLDDEVWRLEKIGKDGAFNKKLSSQGIKTVQEFLKLAVVDTLKLRSTYVDKLVRDAYARWPSLEVIDAVLNDNIAVLTQGDQIAVSVATYDQNQYYSGQSASYVANNNTQMGSSEWSLYQAYSTLPFANGFPSNFSATQTDGDMTASGSSSGC
ncbi:Calmodulin-binding protein [Vigna angularis]|uniref:Calmodulin-binding protein n=1 Tax=Phaseolus angularis TaxID=3914 RepID=A0A8T0JXJ3_PHAAN|nr:Calmodulin-binding protein [Vigna angularis]